MFGTSSKFNFKQVVQSQKVLLSLLIMTFVSLVPVQVHAQFLNDDALMGTNMYNIKDYAPQWVFVDAFKEASSWLSQGSGVWDDGRTINLNSDGYPTSLQSGQWASALVKRGLQGHYPSGIYTLLWDGDGVVTIDKFDGHVIQSSPGRKLVDVNASNSGLLITIKETNPSNPIHNIRVIMPGFESTYDTQPFHPEFLKLLEPFNALRFMDWQRTNFSKVTSWEERATPQTYSQATNQGIALEHMIQLANTTLSDPWFCIPDQVDDHYVREFAKIVRDTLDPRLRVHIEYSNEVWNSQFSQSLRIQETGAAKWPNISTFEARMRQLSARSVEIFDIFEDVFGGTEQLVRTMPAQHANSWTAEKALDWNNAYLKTDALATAPYFGGHLGHESKGLNTPNLSVSQVLDFCEQDVQTQHGKTLVNKSIASARGIRLVAYEGGQHMAGFGSYYSSSTVTELFKAANRHPRMRQIYFDYLNGWNADGGDLFMSFTLIGAVFSNKGCWGLIEWMDEPFDTPKYMGIVDYVNGIQPNIPIVNNFTALPNSILPGGSTTLSWATTNASNVSINNGVGSVPVDGSVTISPSATTLYTLTASGADGTTSATTVVVVEQPGVSPPSVDSFTANPEIVTLGGSVTLAWQTTDATDININPGVGTVLSANGSVTVVPNNTTTYTVSASNGGGTANKSVTVTVISSPVAPSISQQPSNAIVTEGQQAIFNVSVDGSAPFSYQWQRNGQAISGATSASYTTPATTLADSGNTYRCVISNSSGTVTSTSAALTVNEPGDRVVSGLVTLYNFGEGSGRTVHDTSGNGTPLDLTIQGDDVRWLNGALALDSSSAVISDSAATKVIQAIKQTNEITLEAWVVPGNTTQSGPARILTISSSTSSRNATLGQKLTAYEGRVRTTGTDNNGLPSTSTSYGVLDPELQHVVYTRDSNGNASIFVNGKLESTNVITGNMSNWTNNYKMALGNEVTLSRPWIGELHMAAVYSRALPQSDVTQNFEAGPQSTTGGGGTDPIDPPVVPPVDAVSPTIALQPTSQDVQEGKLAEFSVAVDGTSPFMYQWRKNGTNIIGANDSSVFVGPVHVYQSGDVYSCVITNVAGSVTSSGATLTVHAVPVDSRVSNGLKLLYTFQENTGDVVVDRSNVGAPANLKIEQGNNVVWGDHYLDVQGDSFITSQTPPAKLIDAVRVTNEVTLEAWIQSDSLSQWGPARIVSLSASTNRRNVTLGQIGSNYEVRFRTTETDKNGRKATSTTNKPAKNELHHVVYTRNGDGQVAIYVNGEIVATDLVTGITENWGDYELVLANEVKNDRIWKGQFHLVALYSRALNPVEVNQNFSAGSIFDVELAPSGSGSNSFDVNSLDHLTRFNTDNPTTLEPALPSKSQSEGVQSALYTQPLAVRLVSDEPINTDSIWGHLTGLDASQVNISWAYVNENDSNDVWVIAKPVSSWIPGSTLSVSAGASTASAAPLQTVNVTFQISMVALATSQSVTAYEQPVYAEDVAAGHTGIINVVPANSSVPSFELGISDIFTIIPDQALETPQRVWIPLPDGNFTTVGVYYFQNNATQQGWFYGENVDGFIVKDSYLLLEDGGQTYLGFLVTHGGTVQLAGN